MNEKYKIPLLGMGTWGMGGKYERDESNIDTSIESLRFGHAQGHTMVDVAELYGAGLTEEIVGRAMQGSSRKDWYITSKVWKTNLRYDDVLRAAEGSLKRLNTDYMDLYLVHWPSDEVPLEETMRAMETVFDRGMTKAIGVSNFSAELLKKAQSYLRQAKLIANQIEYSLGAKDAEVSIIPFCKQNDIHVIAYRPFAKGALANTHNETVDRLAVKYRKTPNQIALNWIISQGISVIPKAGSRAHILENAGVLGWQMENADIETLRAAT